MDERACQSPHSRRLAPLGSRLFGTVHPELGRRAFSGHVPQPFDKAQGERLHRESMRKSSRPKLLPISLNGTRLESRLSEAAYNGGLFLCGPLAQLVRAEDS
jgi:hypothetical protein